MSQRLLLFLFPLLTLTLAGCKTAPASPPATWISVEGAASLHPHEDPRRMHVVNFEATPEGDGVRVRVKTSAGGPLEYVEVFTTRDLGPNVSVNHASTPHSIAASVRAKGPGPYRTAARLTDNNGVAVLRSPLFASQESFFVVFEKDGYFQEVLEHRGTESPSEDSARNQDRPRRLR